MPGRKITEITQLLITSRSQLSGWKNRLYEDSFERIIFACLTFLASLEICGCKDHYAPNKAELVSTETSWAA